MNLNLKVIFFTSARSDFGILSGVIKEFNKLSKVEVIATGAHTSYSLSDSLKDVEDFCLKQNIVLKKFEFNYEKDGDSISQLSALSSAQQNISVYLGEKNPDLIVFLGDRWELYSISIAALILRIHNALQLLFLFLRSL